MTASLASSRASLAVARSIVQVREAVATARAGGARIGLVPTMGYFHEGHLSLMRRAREECDFVVVSLFVNPAQFNDPADLEQYPRDEERDAAMAAVAGAQLLFAPAPAEIYPAGFATSISVSGVAEPMEGEMRGVSHFRGVATVVAKLFNIVAPDVAYFGQKDAQQALVIRRMVRDLDFPVRIVVCPTVREADGLAMSSRNVGLRPEDRERALSLSRALAAAERCVRAGERSAQAVRGAALAELERAGVAVEYVEVVSASTLRPTDPLEGELLVAIAARVGSVRLIDNALVQV